MKQFYFLFWHRKALHLEDADGSSAIQANILYCRSLQNLEQVFDEFLGFCQPFRWRI